MKRGQKKPKFLFLHAGVVLVALAGGCLTPDVTGSYVCENMDMGALDLEMDPSRPMGIKGIHWLSPSKGYELVNGVVDSSGDLTYWYEPPCVPDCVAVVVEQVAGDPDGDGITDRVDGTWKLSSAGSPHSFNCVRIDPSDHPWPDRAIEPPEVPGTNASGATG